MNNDLSVAPRSPRGRLLENRFLVLMVWLANAALLFSVSSAAETISAGAARLVGAGSSLAAPIIESWAAAFAQGSRVDVRFDSVGSGAGIRRLVEGSVDFAVTDVPLMQTDLTRNDLVQYPLVAAAIVPVANVPGINAVDLRLSGEVLAQIFLGRISQWNDPAIHALNPRTDLPDLPIKVIHRSDTSGTTFTFTYYLSKTSAAWETQLGIGSRVDWTAGDGARGNEGVARVVNRTAGAIGYVALGEAIRLNLQPIQLRNRAGRFVAPTEASIGAAVQGAAFSRSSFYQVIVDPECEGCWPIVAVSYMLVSRKLTDVAATRSTLEFLHWVYHEGARFALAAHYVPITNESLVARIETSFSTFRESSGKPMLNP